MAGIYDRHIEDELKQSYIDYAMSVIVGRALPDVRDGLKPVQRRIVYSMYESGNTYDKPYKKSARVVGDVLGKYHPHGDASVYDALVRMAQDFVMRYPLVDGHGNFGSMDGDPPAAMRYTEVRLTRLADYLTDDLDKETVNWTPNFDGSLEEPEVLPAVFPQLLVNGASGIAVGVSTSIPPHNIGEVIDATLCLLRDPGVSVRELMKFVKGPDFPTGGEIVNDRELPEIYERGKGTIKIRGRAYFEEGRAHKGELIIYEIPYMVNKAELVTEIAELVRLKKLSGVDEVRDESNRHGVRIVLELKKGASPGHILSQLYDQTSLEVTYGINMVALKDGMPVQLGLKDALQSFIEFRKEVVTRRTRYLLDKALHRQEVLQGIAKALDYIDLVIEIIRGSETTDEALAKLMQQVGLTQIQAEAVLETRLKSLVHMEKSKIFDELDKLGQQIAEYHEILSSEAKLLDVISAELQKVKQAFADDGRTAIGATRPQMKETTSGVVYIELLDSGVVRRSKSEPQSRDHIAVDASDFVVFLTNFGKVFAISAYEIPESQKGTALSNIFALASDEKIIAMARPDDDLVAITERGKGKRFRIDLSKIPSRGGYYFLLSPDDRVAVVGPYAEELVVVTAQGRGMRINGESIPERGLKTGGVKAVRVATDDKVVGFVPASREYIITMTENAYMKKTMIADVPRRGRGSLGVRIHKVNDKTGPVIGISASEEILYRAGREWRKISAEEIPGSSRATMGVKILRTTVNRLF